jgi:hypothetical protein
MSEQPEIKCALCEYQFKLCSKVEEDYHNHEIIHKTCYYPAPDEKAHLIQNYICDDCYNNMSDVVRNELLKAGKEYIDGLQERKDYEYKKYLEAIKKLEEKNKNVEDIYKTLVNTKSILDLDKDMVIKLTTVDKYPHYKGAFYLESAIEVEKRNKLNMKYTKEWLSIYNISMDDLPKGFSMYSLVTEDEFKNILNNERKILIYGKDNY